MPLRSSSSPSCVNLPPPHGRSSRAGPSGSVTTVGSSGPTSQTQDDADAPPAERGAAPWHRQQRSAAGPRTLARWGGPATMTTGSLAIVEFVSPWDGPTGSALFFVPDLPPRRPGRLPHPPTPVPGLRAAHDPGDVRASWRRRSPSPSTPSDACSARRRSSRSSDVGSLALLLGFLFYGGSTLRGRARPGWCGAASHQRLPGMGAPGHLPRRHRRRPRWSLVRRRLDRARPCPLDAPRQPSSRPSGTVTLGARAHDDRPPSQPHRRAGRRNTPRFLPRGRRTRRSLTPPNQSAPAGHVPGGRPDAEGSSSHAERSPTEP
jgi:hypothetical protein